MSFKSALSLTNLLFLAGGIYFIVLAALAQAPIYTVVIGIFCFIAFALSFEESWYFTGPWRVGTAVAVLVLLSGQIYTSFSIVTFSDTYTIGVIVLNGVWFVVFLGVLLSSAREVARIKSMENEEELEEEPAT